MDTHLCPTTLKNGKTAFKAKTRHGSYKDVEKLTNMFNNFCSAWKFIRNEEGSDICRTLDNIAREGNLKHDGCVVCVLSHGELGIFFDYNWNKIEENEITNILKKHFVGKPKLLFMQTCRTHDPYLQNTPSGGAKAINAADKPLDNTELFIGRACCEEQKAYRHKASGSFFIQALCEVFQEKFHEMDVESMFREVRRRVSSRANDYEKLQVCVGESTLFSKVYFRNTVKSDI